MAWGADAKVIPMSRPDSAPAPLQSDAHAEFRAARDLLLHLRADQDEAWDRFRWPRLGRFNWARDWFDHLAADPVTGRRTALWLVESDGTSARYTFAELSERSRRLATWLQGRGVSPGDRVLMMLGNQVELWETLLACMRLGAVVVPATPLLGAREVADRLERGAISQVIARSDITGVFAELDPRPLRIAVGDPVPGWLTFGAPDEDDEEESRWTSAAVDTRAGDSLLLYFTSGTTAVPKLVEHTHASYPIGHLSTMYWLGLRPGDVHLNISSPGWAKHAWSNVFAPWNAEATVLVVNQPRFSPAALLDTMAACGVTTFCAPPTVWRMLIKMNLAAYRGRIPLREVVSAGEPLNPEIINAVGRAWGVTLRDGYGQTETTAQIANCPGQRVIPGSMGRALPGYLPVIVDPSSGQEQTGMRAEGELCLRLDDAELGAPLGLMTGYQDGVGATPFSGGALHHTGDIVARDEDGYYLYVGRSDDIFKASDYRISPFELESVVLEHPAVVEAAVVPSPDPVRLAVPKVFVALNDGWEPDEDTAAAVLRHARSRLPRYQRIRRIEFLALPKTTSGKIRRVDLRELEASRHSVPGAPVPRARYEFWEEDLTDVLS